MQSSCCILVFLQGTSPSLKVPGLVAVENTLHLHIKKRRFTQLEVYFLARAIEAATPNYEPSNGTGLMALGHAN